MPALGLRRRRSNPVESPIVFKEPPKWFLRRREEEWNGRFAVEGPSVSARAGEPGRFIETELTRTPDDIFYIVIRVFIFYFLNFAKITATSSTRIRVNSQATT